MSEPVDLSIVIPLYNERDSLQALYAEISAVAAAQGYRYEIIFVDDGSKDDSWQIVRELAQQHRHIRAIRFRRNFGKAAALQAAFRIAQGERAITLDADLQDDPAEIPHFLQQMDQGLDLVVGWKKIRHDPWHKVLPSRVFNGMVSRLTGVHLHDHNCGMKAYRREVYQSIRLYGELHRFVPVLADARGYRVGEIIIQHRARKFGKSKYGIKRFLRGFLDLLAVSYLTTYGRRPMHLLGSWALMLLGLGIVCQVFNLFHIDLIPISPSTAGFFILAFVVFLFGLQAETLASLRTDEPYDISERL